MVTLRRNRRKRVFADDRRRTTARSCAGASHNGVKLWVCSTRSDQRRRSIVGPPTVLTSFLVSLDGKLTEPLAKVHFCATKRRCDRNRVSGETMVSRSSRAFGSMALALRARRASSESIKRKHFPARL